MDSMTIAMQSNALKAVGNEVATAARPLIGRAVADVHACFARFLRDPYPASHAGALDMHALQRVLGIDTAACSPLVALLTGARRVGAHVDGFLLFAVLVVCAAANPATKVRLLYQLFDLDSNGALTADEVVVLLRCVLHGVAAVTKGTPTPTDELERISREGFSAADIVTDGRLSLSEFSGWVRESAEARALLRLFPSTGTPMLPWEGAAGPGGVPSPRRRTGATQQAPVAVGVATAISTAAAASTSTVPSVGMNTASPNTPHRPPPLESVVVDSRLGTGNGPASPTSPTSTAPPPPSPRTRRRRMDALLQRIESVSGDVDDITNHSVPSLMGRAPGRLRSGPRGGDRRGGGRAGARAQRTGGAGATAAGRRPFAGRRTSGSAAGAGSGAVRVQPVVLRYTESRRSMAEAYMAGGDATEAQTEGEASQTEGSVDFGILPTVESDSDQDSETECAEAGNAGGSAETGAAEASGAGSKRGRPVSKRRAYQGRFHKAQVLEVVKRFNRMDEDRSGTVSVLEFAREMGSTMATTTQLFSAVDKDGSGEISLVELLQLNFSGATRREWDQILRWSGLRGATASKSKRKERRALTEAELVEIREVFESIDTDRDGLVTFAEVVGTMTSEGGLERAEAMQMCIDADIDQNGQLDFDEFRDKLMDHFLTDTMASIMATYRREGPSLPPPPPQTAPSKSQKRRALGIHTSFKAT